jgi:hypothetical protein
LASDSLSGTHFLPARTLSPDILERKWHDPVGRRNILPVLVILNLLVIDFLVFIFLPISHSVFSHFV